ncbi:MAG: pyrroline-5-carboxylate reductase [Brevinematales bacterium]|nr:pyrroline-5-carboxylate reductase [Brevinematales bacterium]
MKLGVIGYGQMGQAIVRGVVKKNLFDSILVYDVAKPKLSRLPRSTSQAQKIEEVFECDILLLAIKPQDVPSFCETNRTLLKNRNTVLVTIVAGLPVAFYRQWTQAPLARVMPNTPAQVGEGASGIYFDGDLPDTTRQMVITMFASLGIAEVVTKEDLLHAVTGLSGSGPAYVMLFLSALADGGVMEGLPRDIAKRLAIQTVLGSAALAREAMKNGKSFEDLKDMVMSPGGTTARGLYALEEGKLRSVIMKAVSEATKRSRELGGK